MKAYLISMHLLVPRSRSSAKVKVKYKGYISQKMAVSGAFVFRKHFLSFMSLPNDKSFDSSKLKIFADSKINVTEKLKFVLGRIKKHCGKRRKCWLPAFSPFLTLFSKGYFLQVVKILDCVVRNEATVLQLSTNPFKSIDLLLNEM